MSIVVTAPHARPGGPQPVTQPVRLRVKLRRTAVASAEAVRAAAGTSLRFALTGAAFFKRDLLADLSYRFSFVLHSVHVLIGIAAYYFLARFVDRAALRGADPFSFLLIGLALNAYMATWLICFTQAIRTGQTTGTLKLVLSSPVSGPQFIVLSALYPGVRAAADAAVYLLGGWALGASLAGANLSAAGVILILSSLSFASIGIGSAAFTLVFKRGDPLLWLFMSLSCLLGGVLYPVDLLPARLQELAWLLPITHAVNASRLALVDGGGQLAQSMTGLALFALVGLPVSLAAFRIGLWRSRVTGSLGHV